MLYLLDMKGAANPEPITQDNFETIERELLNFPWGVKTALETRTSNFATPDAAGEGSDQGREALPGPLSLDLRRAGG